MITYKRCSEVENDLVYQAFRDGFSDYMIQFNLTKDQFIQQFFGPEGNATEHSFIAFHGDDPVGLMLGGIKNYENVKTIRCGALALSPSYRGLGISNELFIMHKEEAIKHDCRQLFLEVIVGNDRAIKFYQKLGYEKVYDISFFSLRDLSKLKDTPPSKEITVSRISFQEFELAVDRWKYFHINWQNDIDFMREIKNDVYYGAYVQEKLVGCLCINNIGKISCIIVDRDVRGKGVATHLLYSAHKELEFVKMSIAFPNNGLLAGFLKHIGFKKDSIAQYEMYLTL